MLNVINICAKLSPFPPSPGLFTYLNKPKKCSLPQEPVLQEILEISPGHQQLINKLGKEKYGSDEALIHFDSKDKISETNWINFS